MPFDHQTNDAARTARAPWGALPGDADMLAPLDRSRHSMLDDALWYRREPARLTLMARRRAMPVHILEQAATRLDDYFRFRAARRGCPYAMSPRFFAASLLDGRRDFWGALVNDAGEIAEDGQRPECLRAWRACHRVAAAAE